METNKQYLLLWVTDKVSIKGRKLVHNIDVTSALVAEYVECFYDETNYNGRFKVRNADISKIPSTDLLEIINDDEKSLVWIKISNVLINNFDLLIENSVTLDDTIRKNTIRKNEEEEEEEAK